MSVVVTPSARETFTPRELADAYEDFETRGPAYLDEEIGIQAGAYRFGERVLLVYEETETSMVVLFSRSHCRRSRESEQGLAISNGQYRLLIR